MRRKAQPSWLLAIIVVAGFMAFNSCGGSSAAIVTSVTISPTSVTVQINTQCEITAVVNLSNGTSTTPTTVTWQVNSINGGNSTVGTIVASSNDNLVGVYTAPATVPTTNNGQVTVTATTPQSPTTTSTTSTTTLVTSNDATITVGIGQGLAVSPTTATVPAGGSFQFAATLNSVPEKNVTWSVSSTSGGTIGSIDPSTGIYTAPLYPPPGGEVTITAQYGTLTATAIATIVFSDHSLNGPFAFSYTGNDQLGFQAVAGSFVADGNGHIVSGVEDTDSFSSGASTEVPFISENGNSYPGTYVVGPDGRASAVINTSSQIGITLQFVLVTDQHGLITSFDRNSTGSGRIDQQSLNALTNSDSVLSGPYVFSAFGANPEFNPMGIAGKFTANGSGNIPETNTILDVNDDGTVTRKDTSLNGSYYFDLTFPGTGRGVLTLTSSTTSQLQFGFYVVDSTHAHIVEIDSNGYLAGDVFSAPAVGNLTTANYVFTSGGMAASGAYTAGGVFAWDQDGKVTGGVFDNNHAGTVTLAATVNACPSTLDTATGRIDLTLATGGGTCSAGASTYEFAVYQTSSGSALMLELDSKAITSGLASKQNTRSALSVGSYAVNLGGQGIFHNSPANYQPTASGQVTLNSTSVGTGNLDINNYNAVYKTDPICTTTSTIVTTNCSLAQPDATYGRGTLVLVGSDPVVTYNLSYYVINGNTALLFDQDKSLFMIGTVIQQF
jgi:hypothetical protein